MAVEAWQDWRLEANGYTWRIAVEADMPALEAHFRTMDARLGDQDRPPLFEVPTMITLVAEDAEGLVRGGCYVGYVAEVAFIGMDKAVFQSTEALMPHLVSYAAEKKLRVAQIKVPRVLRRLLAPLYQRVGFQCVDEDSSHFARKIRE